MATIEISKIQLRQGAEADLQPTSLDAGEMTFTTDAGRLYIGPDTNLVNHPRKGRSVHPYENIEVLTETAIDTFARMHDRLDRVVGPAGLAEGDLTRKAYLKAALPANSSGAVQVDRINPATGLFDGLYEPVVLAEEETVGSSVQYFLFDESDSTLVRSGTLTINHNGVTTNPLAYVDDQYIVRSHLSSGSSIFTTADAYASTALRFQATLASGKITLEFDNDTATNYTLLFRVMTAAIPVP